MIANQILESCSSTNDLAKELGNAGFPHGTWVSSRVQESGRGRLGRRWESIKGNLFLSVIVRIPESRLCNWGSWGSWIPLTAAVAVCRCLREMFPGLDIRVKWPNDLYIQNGIQSGKLGGILCESAGSSNQMDSFIVIGLGLNCVGSPLHVGQATRNLTQARGGILTHADEIRIPIISALLEEIQLLTQYGTPLVKDQYERWAVIQNGMEVEWGSMSGLVQGLGSAGELKVVTRDGSEASLFAEEVKVSLKN